MPDTTPPRPAWIKVIDEGQADGPLKNVYDSITARRGKLSNIMRAHSLHPRAMAAHMDLYLAIMFERGGLRREDCELIAVVVSSTNDCAYCVRHHAEALRAYWKDDDKVQQVATDHQAVNLDAARSGMLDYVVKLTKAPQSIRESDVEALREIGFSDRTILDINLVTSYFNFVNRIALGLGVDFTEDEAGGYKY